MPFDSGNDPMKSWKLAGFTATAMLVMAFPVYMVRTAIEKSNASAEEGAQFVGRQTCIECHKKGG